jgi:hypothetical protein
MTPATLFAIILSGGITLSLEQKYSGLVNIQKASNASVNWTVCYNTVNVDVAKTICAMVGYKYVMFSFFMLLHRCLNICYFKLCTIIFFKIGRKFLLQEINDMDYPS